jgi:hypothetical protein
MRFKLQVLLIFVFQEDSSVLVGAIEPQNVSYRKAKLKISNSRGHHSIMSSKTCDIRVGDYSDNLYTANMLLDPAFSDVEFVVEKEVFPAHKAILSARSAYFR